MVKIAVNGDGLYAHCTHKPMRNVVSRTRE